nr:transglutaminase domain-containing protein [Candidatus Freyarchaeota archaeon]
MVSRKAVIAITLILLILLGLGAAYFFLSSNQNTYVQQVLNYATVTNIRQIYYPWITPINTNFSIPQFPQDWFNNIFNLPNMTLPNMTLPNMTLPNMTLPDMTFIPPIYMFDYGLIDPNMIVLIVHPNDSTSPTRYWRLEAYDRYYMDWNKTLTGSYPHNPINYVPSSPWELYTVYMNFTHSTSSSTIIPALFANYTIVEAGGYTIQTIQGDLISFNISMDQYNSTFLNGGYTGSGLSTINYTAAGYPFNLAVINSTAGYPGQTPSYISSVYTQVPSYLEANTTFMNFVNSIDDSGTVYQTAMSALSLLTGGAYTYNMSILLNGGGPPQGEDPVLWFLEGGQGICVHFASAFVMALRELGISARLVVGFVGGQITVDPQLGLVHIIRAINAHAWAEVWVPTSSGGGEWVQFDPTPGPAQNGTNPDPNVQGAYHLELNASPLIVPRGTSITINATLTNATSGSPVSGANVSFYIFDPVTMNRIFIGNDTTDGNGLAQNSTTLNNSFRVGPVLFLAEAYNQTISSSIPIATNYTGVLLNGTSQIDGMSATSTATYQGNNYYLIRNEGGVIVEGRLIDPDCANSSIMGIPNVNIEVYRNGTTFVTSGLTNNTGYFQIYCPGSSLDLTDYIFSANFSGDYLGLPITPATSASDSNGIHVYVRPSLSVSVNPSTLRNSNTTNITARLVYDNGTGINNIYVSIWWDNSTAGGAVTRLTNSSTNSSGYVLYTNTAWETEAVVQVFANCSQSGRILGVNSSQVNVYIYDTGLIVINYAPNDAAIGDTITVSGWVLDGSGAFRPNTSITIWFYGPTQSSYPATTNSTGYFSRNIVISNSNFYTGYYTINATDNEQLFNASSTSRIIRIYVRTTIGSSGFGYQSLSLNGIYAKQSVEPRSVLPTENAYITGVLRDSFGVGIPGETISVYYGPTLLGSDDTGINGEFNITLDSSDLSILPVNALSALNISYAGDEFHSGSWRVTELHVFNSAQLVFQSPSVGVLGSYYDIRCTSVDSNGNPIMGRTINITWNSTNLSPSVTSGAGTILYTYFINPNNNTVGNVTIVLTLDTGSSNSATVYITQGSDFGGLAVMLLLYYALQMGSEASWLLVIIVLAVVAVICVICLARRVSPKEEKKAVTPMNLQARIAELKDLVGGGKFNDAVKYLYGMFADTVNQYSGIVRAPNETTREFAVMVIKKEGLNPQLVNGLTQLFEKARYSSQTLEKEDYNKAAKYFAELYSLISGGSLKLA